MLTKYLTKLIYQAFMFLAYFFEEEFFVTAPLAFVEEFVVSPVSTLT